MTESTGRRRSILVHSIDPHRSVKEHDNVVVLPRASTVAGMAPHLESASALVVDDALAFPFEGLRQSDRDIPCIVRLPERLDAFGLEQVLGSDLLDHLTPFDQLAGPSGAVRAVLRNRRMPETLWIGDADVTIDQLIARGMRGLKSIDSAWRPVDGRRPALINVPLPTVSLHSPGGRLRALKSRVRVERAALQRALAQVQERQPGIRDMRVAVFGRQPEVWASALPRRVASWTGFALAPLPEEPGHGPGGPLDILEVPESGRLPLDAGTFDAVLMVGNFLQAPPHAISRVFHEACQQARRGGWLVVLADVVAEPADAERRVRPLSARECVALANDACGRQLLLHDVESIRRAGERHHRLGMFVMQYLGTGKET